MFLRQHHRSKDGKEHGYWSLVETVRTPDGPRQRTICYLGELHDSTQARWQKTIEDTGIRPQRWTICCTSRKARSTTRGCIAVWIVSCHVRPSWSSIPVVCSR